MSTLTSGVPQMSLTKEVFECSWFRIQEESWTNLSATHGRPFYRIDSAPGVLVWALTQQEEIILVRQFRPALRKYTLEFPAGSMEKGETPDESAARELLEETGYQAGRIHVLGSGHIMMNRYSARDYLVFAQQCQFTCSGLNGSECDVLLKSLSEFQRLVTTGEFEHIPALALFNLVHWKLGSKLMVER
ncbi:MAG: NUDIX hydrolase [Nitrospirales bacterium]|nr:NUDIX hydrolase [Nitrospirales bacterium]